MCNRCTGTNYNPHTSLETMQPSRNGNTKYSSISGITKPSIPTTTTNSRNVPNAGYRPTAHGWSNYTRRRATLDTIQQRPTLHTGQRLLSTSSSTVQTTQYKCTRLGNLETATCQVLHTSRYTKCRLPCKTTETTIQRTEV